MATRCLACVLLDFFIASVELADRPHLRGKPIIVGGDPHRRGLVIGASPEAMAPGVAPGMLTWEALRLCPQATLIAPHPDLYHNKAQMVLSILSLYSDHVEHSQLDCFYLTMPGDAGDIVADIQRQLSDQAGISASIGVASSKLVAHMAARLHTPAGLEVVPAGQEAASLAPLPLDWLVADEKMLTQLKRLGLRTIGDLAAVPEPLLISHIGDDGKTLLRHAQGKDARAVRSTQQRATTEREHIFDQAQNEREALRRWVVYLSGGIGQDLRAHKQHARTLTLTMGHLDGAPAVLTAVLPKATDLDHTLRDAALHLLAAWDGRAGIASLGIEAGVFSDEPGFQLNLFSEDKSEWEDQQHRFDHAKNGLNKRYGQGTVMAAMLLNDDILAAMGKRRREK
jgi:DNA polymerase IV